MEEEENMNLKGSIREYRKNWKEEEVDMISTVLRYKISKIKNVYKRRCTEPRRF